MSFQRCDQTEAWAALNAHFEASGKQFDLRAAFAADAERFDRFAVQAPGVFADLSKNRWDASTRALLTGLAAECGLEARRDAMFAGEPINLTEGRAVLHTALRAPADAKSLGVVTDAAIADVHSVLEPLLAYAERVRAQAGTQFTDVLNIGNTWAASLQATGAFMPFDDAAMQAIGGKDKFVKPALDTGGAPGKDVTSVPLYGLAYGLYYNKQMFKDAGLNPPTTWEEMVSAAQKLTDPAKKQYGFSLAAGSYTEYVRCGMQPPCSDHTVIVITVTAGQTTTGVDLRDWYAPQGAFPAPPA